MTKSARLDLLHRMYLPSGRGVHTHAHYVTHVPTATVQQPCVPRNLSYFS